MFKRRRLQGIGRPRHGEKDSAATHFVVVPCADAPYFARCCTWPKSRCRLLRPMVHMAKLPMQATSTDAALGQSAEVVDFGRWCSWPKCRSSGLRALAQLANVPKSGLRPTVAASRASRSRSLAGRSHSIAPRRIQSRFALQTDSLANYAPNCSAPPRQPRLLALQIRFEVGDHAWPPSPIWRS